jgi:hypothetical protein
MQPAANPQPAPAVGHGRRQGPSRPRRSSGRAPALAAAARAACTHLPAEWRRAARNLPLLRCRARRSMRQLPVQKSTTPRSNLQPPLTPQGQQQTFASDEALLKAVGRTPPKPAAIPHPTAAAEALQLKAASMNAAGFGQWQARAKGGQL